MTMQFYGALTASWNRGYPEIPAIKIATVTNILSYNGSYGFQWDLPSNASYQAVNHYWVKHIRDGTTLTSEKATVNGLSDWEVSYTTTPDAIREDDVIEIQAFANSYSQTYPPTVQTYLDSDVASLTVYSGW